MQNLMPPINTPDQLFHDGDPTQGIEGTLVTAGYLNNQQGATRDLQQELLNVLGGAHIQPDPKKTDQLLTALRALLLSRKNPFGDIKLDGTVQKALENLGLGEGSALPVGVPVPWPLAVPPAGWLKCNGAAFTASQYPQLALAYPSLRLPDLRGEFIRGWDDGRGVDSGRTILSFQEGTIVSGFDDNDTGDISSLGSANYGFGDSLTSNQWNTINGKKWIFDASSKGAQRYDWWAYVSARPRNIAFNYIVRAA
ncbi:phage tail protein [Escherichia coli]|uniref:phage tail protein n=1 Tax=Escherichia coli TaxID=562 RepID=UPI000B1D3FD7|nr:phage tail protein [Escherichia coli]MCT6175583.1 tail fiber protein [Escherichia coli]MEC9621790.1 phage tail protein [Escherichia coli]MED0144864.1 phage tail protein [Escherichia coli]MED8990391.1 phage tail protein [Escherichia coli]MED9332361.1 phage tail protein [Escherichia coli]